MMLVQWFSALVMVVLLQAPSPATISPQRFVGTWVGIQSWAIDNPPPGARQDQPVTLTIDIVDGQLVGTMMPFMGGQDGATFTTTQIVGDELLASAVVGRMRAARASAQASASAAPADEDTPPGGPSAAAGRGRRGGPLLSWKDSVRIAFSFKNDGVNLAGTADVLMGDMKWLKFKYDLSKKRSRY